MNQPEQVNTKRPASGRVAIFNLDGTISDDRARRALVPTDARSMNDFAAYHDQLHRDPALEYGAAILANHVSNGDFIVFVTGRPMKYADATAQWLQATFGMLPQRDFLLLLRHAEDERSTVELKSDFVTYLNTNYCPQKELTIVSAYDNRRDVVEMYIDKGIDATILNSDGEFIVSSKYVDVKAEVTDAPPMPPELGRFVQHPTGDNIGAKGSPELSPNIRDRFEVNVDAKETLEAFERQLRDNHAATITREPTVEIIEGHTPRKHAHYFKACPYDEIDVYRVLELFAITDQAIGHALKKLLVAGGRGAGKDITRDVAEARDTLVRWLEMRAEEAVAAQEAHDTYLGR